MGSPGQVLRRTLRSLWEDMFVLVLASALWALIGVLPTMLTFGTSGALLGFPLALFPTVIVLLLTLPPVTAGLFYLTNRLAHDLVGKVSHVIEGTRLYARPAWILGLLNTFILAVAAANFSFYASFDAPWVVFVRAIWVALLMLWGYSQLYVIPMLMEQKEPSVRLALRNSLFLAFGSPALTITVTLMLVILAFLMFIFLPMLLRILPVLLLLPVVIADLLNQAAVQRLKAIRGDKDVESDVTRLSE